MQPAVIHLFAGCSESWLSYGNSCYFIREDWKAWRDAKNTCSGLGGHLVTITSNEENTYIGTLISEHCWIGLTDPNNDGNHAPSITLYLNNSSPISLKNQFIPLFQFPTLLFSSPSLLS